MLAKIPAYSGLSPVADPTRHADGRKAWKEKLDVEGLLQRLVAVRGQDDRKKQVLNVPNSRLVAQFGTGFDPK